LTTTITSNDSDCHTPLVALSPTDKPWDTHRKHSTIVEGHYRASTNHKSYAERMSVCSLFLDFKQVPSQDSLKLKLSAAHFCRVRWCPVCQWRRSLMWKAKASKILPSVLEAYPKYRWLFVTLTVKNCQIGELRSTITHMNKSFQRLSELKDFPAEGWLKAVEVTRSKDGTAHPHFHIMMMVKPSYFSTGYLSLDKWKSMWAKSLRIDYEPQIDIKALKDKGANFSALLSEVIKYQVKESDLVVDRDWFIELTKQLHKTRAISSGGILKQYLRELEDEPEDLIGEGDEDVDDTLGHLFFAWMQHYQQYRQVDATC
jgi:plasmid rolling circle replication initiator protein Rep